MPVANSEKVRRRKEDMELGCYSSHSRTSTAASLGPIDNNSSYLSTPTSSRRSLRRKSSIHNHPSSAPGRPSSGLNDYLANDSNGGGVLPTPPPFGGSSRSIFSRNSTPATPPGRRRSRLEERSSSLTDNSSYHSRVSRSKSPIRGRSNHSSVSRSKSPIQGRSYRSRGAASKSPIQGRAKFSSSPDLPSIGEKKKSKTKKKVQRDSSKSPISARKKFTNTDIPPPPPPPPSFDSPLAKTPRKTKKSPISDKRKKATQSPASTRSASTRKSKEDPDAKPMSHLSSLSDNKPLSGASIPAPKKVVIDGKTVLVQEVPVTKEEAELLNSRQDRSAAFEEMKERKGWGGQNFQPMANIQVEKRPPRTLIIIWLLMAGELGFDLATTWIAFASFLGGEDCCGYEIELGPLPLSATVPFLLLVLAEMTLLGRAIFLTLWPSREYKHDEENQNEETTFQKNLHSIMCFLKWNAKFVLRAINLCTVINPFLSCLVAWVLMYEGDRTEALVVLGLEAGGIIMHMMSVYMEGECKNRKTFIFHSLPIIPFIITVSLCLVYLKNGGVCYLVGNKVFNFHGCEVCEEDGAPPIDGMCGNTTVSGGANILDNLLGDITARTLQGTYCAGPDDPDGTNFCFYSY